MHKLRDLMAYREDQYKLNGEIEVDEIFIRVANTLQEDEKLQAGKGSQRQATAIIAIESSKENDKGPKGGKRMGYVKVQPIQGHGAIVAKRALEKMTETLRKIVSDKGHEFGTLSTLAEHEAVLSTRENNDEHLPWIGVITANIKRAFLGIYHSIKRENLARYLAEFCYEVNRRKFGMKIFERLLNISVLPKLVVN